MGYACRIVADSISAAGKRITTLEVTYPRFVHAELLTHRMLSRNSSSSRAIPVAKLMEQVTEDPAMPVYWGKNQRGMQAAEELTGYDRILAKQEWMLARDRAVEAAEVLVTLGLHKQIVNRLLEPWMYITVLVTATEWANFFKLRCHRDAQPEIRKIAEMMRDAVEDSSPHLLPTGHWHLPFNDIEDEDDAKMVCVARCARVSYMTHDGQHDPARDILLAAQLAESGHWSPFEHVAQALSSPDERCANFYGWRQLRADMERR